MELTRRRALGALAAAPAVLEEGLAMADETKAAPGGAARQRWPLPFDARKLKGLSEKLLVSHWENNYGGALKNLQKVEEELTRVGKDTPGYLVAGLKERELTFSNSATLHELYFGNLGGDGKPGGAVQAALAEAHGSFGRWEEQFRATAMSLAGGSGWAVLHLDLHTGALRTAWSGGHTQALAAGLPLLVLDLYEHAYALDFGAAAARYVDAFFQNLRWEEVERRFVHARRAHAALTAPA